MSGWLGLERFRPRLRVLLIWVYGPGSPGAASPPPRAIRTPVSPEADEDQVREIALATALSPREVVARNRRGARWATLRIDGRVAVSGWISTGAEWIGEVAAWFRPGAREAYVWDCVASTRFRGRGNYPRMLRAVNEWLKASGVERVWIATAWWNWRSIQGIIRAGYRPAGAIVALRAGRGSVRRLIPAPDADAATVAALRQALAQKPARRLSGGDHRKWLEPPRADRGLLAADDRPLERPGARAVDPDERQSA